MTPLQNLGAPSDTEELGTPLEVRFGSVVETEASNCATSFYFATISRFASDQTSSDALPIISSPVPCPSRSPSGVRSTGVRIFVIGNLGVPGD